MTEQIVVAQQAPAEAALAAFAMWDDSVYMSWAKAVVDLIATADVDIMANGTVPEAAHLVYTLMDAAEEYRERDKDRKRKLVQDACEAAGVPV